MNRTKYLFATTLFIILGLQSCDDGFEEMNTNPDASLEPTPSYLFTKAQLDAVDNDYFNSAALACGGSVQHFATYKEVPAIGDKYLSENYTFGYFENAFPNALNEIQTVINATIDDAEAINILSVARIWKVFILHRITDLYGDIPVSEATKGYTNANYTPAYDKQADIYSFMLQELEEAATSLDASMPTLERADLCYDGDTGKWKKFAYSLMLRLGMRLTKVDEAAARSWVQKAIAGGVITEDSDIAFIEYTDGPQTFNRNPVARELVNGDYKDGQDVDNVEGGKLSKTFIDHLKNTNDPRLNVISIVWVPSDAGGFVADTTTALQQGMENGAYNSRPAEFITYSEPNPATILKYTSPLLVMTNSDMHLLLAEAAIRGWYNRSATEAYNSAVAASMRSWGLFGPGGVIPSAKTDDYLDQNPFPVAGSFEDKMNAIQTQKWVSLFLDEYEIFANWRRTGYPVLTPVNYPGNLTGGTIPRRFVYPTSEESVNATHYYEAIDQQGPNLLTTRVWWDVK